MITTQVTWAGGPPSSEILRSLSVESLPIPDGMINDPETNDLHVTRSWPDLAAAQEWIDLVNQHGPKSAVIVTE